MNHDKILKLLLNIEGKAIAENVIVTPVIPLQFFKSVLNSPFITNSFCAQSLISKNVTVIKSPMGASLVGDIILSLKNTTAKNIFFIGSCGGIKSSAGDIILAERAFYDESFSHSTLTKFADSFGQNSSASPDLLKKFSVYLKDEKVNFVLGDIFSTGSFFSETSENIDFLATKNILAVELETSAFYTACNTCGFNSAAVLYVTDTPGKTNFYDNTSQTLKDTIKSSRESIAISVLDFIKTS